MCEVYCCQLLMSKGLVVTTEKKRGQNRVVVILSYSLVAWDNRRRHGSGSEKRYEEKRNNT